MKDIIGFLRAYTWILLNQNIYNKCVQDKQRSYRNKKNIQFIKIIEIKKNQELMKIKS